MADDSENQLLKEVSRSFYLTLRLLPWPMRRAASLGYLLARTSDTLADSVAVPADLRLEALNQFQSCITRESPFSRWPTQILNGTAHQGEHRLLQSSDRVIQNLYKLPDSEASLVREVMQIIIKGQTLDLQRFYQASGKAPVALSNDADLEDYTWRVAGCVGAFWTQLGFLTLGENFSKSPKAKLVQQGITYGKALQLVNILRDVAEDLAAGRCYLPVADPRDSSLIVASHALWLARAEQWLGEGEKYAATLDLRRLRAATILPVLLARKTLEPLRLATWNDLQRRNKISRRAVYGCLVRALLK